METMLGPVAHLLRFAEDIEEGAHVDPGVSLLRHGVEAVLTLAASMERDACMAGHEGPSSAETDELQYHIDKVTRFACAFGYDAVDEVGVLVIVLVCGIWKSSRCTNRRVSVLTSPCLFVCDDVHTRCTRSLHTLALCGTPLVCL